MKSFIVCAFSLFLLNCGPAMGPQARIKSNEPPTTAISWNSQTLGDIKATLSKQLDGGFSLSVVYSGALLPDSSSWQDLKMDLLLRGVDGKENRITVMPRTANVASNSWTVTYFLSSTCNMAQPYACLSPDVYPTSDAVTELLKPFAIGHGRTEDFDLVVSFVDQYGNWDDLGGQGYKFHFAGIK